MARPEYRWMKPRLHEWGAWRRKEITLLGYPSISPEYRGMVSPGWGTKPSEGIRYEPASEEIMQTQIIVEAMEALQQIALWCRYVQNIEPKRGAVVCGLASENKYWDLVERSERAFGKKVRERYCTVPPDLV